MPRKIGRSAVGRQKRITIGLWTLAVAAWAAEIIADNLSASGHVLADIRVVTLAATIGAFNSLIIEGLDRVNERLGKAYEAMARLYRDRPDPAATTPPPWRGLRSVAADDDPALRNGHGATRGSSGA